MSEGLVQTKSSLLRKSADFQEVVFTSYKSKAKSTEATTAIRKKNAMPERIPKSEERERFMRRTRHEVIKLGLSGFDPTKREQTKQALAISLGAKPKKNKCINYKELKEMRAKQIRDEAEKTAFNSLGKSSTGEALAKIKTRMNLKKRAPRGDSEGGILNNYGKVKKSEISKKTKK